MSIATTPQAPLRRAPEIPAGMDYETFLDWLDEDTHAEWIAGQIILMSPASREHQSIAGFLFKGLSEFAAEHDAGEVIPAPFQMKLPVRPSGREPDVLFVAKDRCGIIRDTYLDGAADLVVEVISPESRGRDTLDKREDSSGPRVPRVNWHCHGERRSRLLPSEPAKHVLSISPSVRALLQARNSAISPWNEFARSSNSATWSPMCAGPVAPISRKMRVSEFVPSKTPLR